MKAERLQKYKLVGHEFKGDLVVVDYMEEWKSHEGFGKVGSISILDFRDKAERLATEAVGKHRTLVGVPVYLGIVDG